jgi:hypothetical protein
MRVIALEEHYATQRFLDGPGRRFRDGLASAGARFSGGGGRLLEDLLGDDGVPDVKKVEAAAAVAKEQLGITPTSPPPNRLQSGAARVSRYATGFLRRLAPPTGKLILSRQARTRQAVRHPAGENPR